MQANEYRCRALPTQSGRPPTCTALRACTISTARSTQRCPGVLTGSTTASKRTATWRCFDCCATLGAGVDIVSGGELFRALRAGFRGAGRRIQRSGEDGRRDPARRCASGVRLINVESDGELRPDQCRAVAGRRRGGRGALASTPRSKYRHAAPVHSDRRARAPSSGSRTTRRPRCRAAATHPAAPATRWAGHAPRLSDRGHGAVCARGRAACRRYRELRADGFNALKLSRRRWRAGRGLRRRDTHRCLSAFAAVVAAAVRAPG